MSISAVNSFSRMNKQPAFCALKKILWVDDDKDYKASLSLPLNWDLALPDGDTFEITSKDTFNEGVKALQDDTYDGIIVDGSISKKDDGPEFVDKALKEGYEPEQMIMLSNRDYPYDNLPENLTFLDKTRESSESIAGNILRMLYPSKCKE